MAELMNINDFKSRLGAGGARPNQFKVWLTFPSPIPNKDSDNFLVTAASLPASNVNPTIVQYRGREVKLAGERTFDPWTITVINDTQMSLRNKFEQWSNMMNIRENNGGITLPAKYMVDFSVEQLDRNNESIRTYGFFGAFPITVSEVGLSYGSNDVISEFTVTFQYQAFEILDPSFASVIPANDNAVGI
jgi:hypothetical protein